MIEFDQITTRGGDGGETSIADGSRRGKDDQLIDVIGEVDELHAALGLYKATLQDKKLREEMDWIQRRLLCIGGMLAVPPDHSAYNQIERIDEKSIAKLEKSQKAMMKGVNLPPYFVTYGGSEQGARADWARAVCRRCERRMVALIRNRVMRDLAPAQQFLNRLSDWLFIRARQEDGLLD
ncbi:MAG: cob(I)yrinic acid a,c-diamide adenosyltransferase [Spirochaetales bacterium]|nr:cob(I)yrinic acid a,c-diamide adenosyltransferase [Spirochaetales bacterium]